MTKKEFADFLLQYRVVVQSAVIAEYFESASGVSMLSKQIKVLEAAKEGSEDSSGEL